MVKRIQYMYESGDADYLNLFFSIDSFGDMLNYNNYMSAIAEYDNKMMEEYVATRQEVEEIEARLQQELAELSNLQLAAETEKNKIAGLISQTSTSISQNGEDIAKLEADALKKEEELKQKESDIEALKKKIEEEKALSQAAANAAWRNISEVSFADGDKALLAAIIYCEAGGEPYEGKLAVGAVVINRVLSSKYPDTVVGVIYQKSQFSPVASGRLELVLTSGKATADCYKAAEEAMSGMTNVGNCLYFRTPIEGLTGISIGGHVFY
jgi:spore germination cell wall hydrolase CwlJ-like protein